MSWTLVRAVVLALVGSCLAGCSADPGDPTNTTRATGSATSVALPPDELYVRTARESGYVDAVSDQALLAAGNEVCGALDRGVEPLDVFALATEMDLEAGTTIFSSSVSILCREHLEAAQELAAQLGG